MVEWLLQDPRETALPYEAIVILAHRRAQRAARLLPGIARRTFGSRADGAGRTGIDGRPRRRAPAHRRPARSSPATSAGRGRRRDPGGRAPDRECQSAYRRGAIDRRKHAGGEGNAAASTRDVGIGDRRNMLFSSTVATYGRGRAVVVATGMATEVGRIAGLLEAAEKEPTPLQQELDRTGKRLSIIMLGICAIVFATGLLTSPVMNLNAILSLFLFAVALAVAAIPEALPAIVTVGLSLGVRRMAAANAIVRKLPAVETLGAATVICSDKTGTLTRNEMTVRDDLPRPARWSRSAAAATSPRATSPSRANRSAERQHVRDAVAQTLRAAALANDAALTNSEGRWRVQGDPTEGALIVAARKFGVTEDELARFPRIAEIPFTSERKRHTTVHLDRENPAELRVFVKGAPDILLGENLLSLGGRQDRPAERGSPRRAFAAQRRTRRPGAAHAGDRHAHRAGRRPGTRARGPDDGIADRAAGQHRGRPGAARPGRHDRSAARRGEGRRRHRQAGAHPLGDDHRRSSGDRRGDRPRARNLRAGRAAGDRHRAAHHGGRRARCDRRTSARVRPRRSGAQAAHRRGAAAQRPHRRHDRRRHQRRARAQDRQYRRRHGHHRHRRLEGSRRHGADRRQLRQHRQGDRGRARDLRQYPQIPALSAVVQCRRTAHHVRGRDVCGRARPCIGRARAVPAAARRSTALDQPDHRRAARAGARRRPQGPRRHGAAAAQPRRWRAHQRGLVAPRRSSAL